MSSISTNIGRVSQPGYTLSPYPLPQHLKDQVSQTHRLGLTTLAFTIGAAAINFVVTPVFALPLGVAAVAFAVKALMSLANQTTLITERKEAIGELNKSLISQNGLNLNLLTGLDRFDGKNYKIRNGDLTAEQKSNMILQDFKNLSLLQILHKYNCSPNHNLPGVSIPEFLNGEDSELKTELNNKFDAYLAEAEGMVESDAKINRYTALNHVLFRDISILSRDSGPRVAVADPLVDLKARFAVKIFEMCETTEINFGCSQGFLYIASFETMFGAGGILKFIPSGDTHPELRNFVVDKITQYLFNYLENDVLQSMLSESTNLTREEIEKVINDVGEKRVLSAAESIEKQTQKDPRFLTSGLAGEFGENLPELLKLAEEKPQEYPHLKKFVLNEYDRIFRVQSSVRWKETFVLFAPRGLTAKKIDELRTELAGQQTQ